MTLFKNKYKIESTRMQNWDYGWNAPYFVTICRSGNEHFFGKIDNDNMILPAIGEIVKIEWMKTPEIRPDMNLQLGEWIIMPNHFSCDNNNW